MATGEYKREKSALLGVITEKLMNPNLNQSNRVSEHAQTTICLCG